jgi:hypothetical protein
LIFGHIYLLGEGFKRGFGRITGKTAPVGKAAPRLCPVGNFTRSIGNIIALSNEKPATKNFRIKEYRQQTSYKLKILEVLESRKLIIFALALRIAGA